MFQTDPYSARETWFWFGWPRSKSRKHPDRHDPFGKECWLQQRVRSHLYPGLWWIEISPKQLQRQHNSRCAGLVLVGGQKSRLTNRWSPPCGSRALGTQPLRNNTKWSAPANESEPATTIFPQSWGPCSYLPSLPNIYPSFLYTSWWYK